MKTTFTKEYILERSGCYTDDGSIKKIAKACTINDIIDSAICQRDIHWFVFNSCELTTAQKKEIAIQLAWVVLPIFETKFPKDNRPRKALELRCTAYVAAAAAAHYAVAAAHYAVAVAVTAVAAVTAAVAAVTAAAAAADAADAADKTKNYIVNLKNTLKEFFRKDLERIEELEQNLKS